jgi:hypothetical protein
VPLEQLLKSACPNFLCYGKVFPFPNFEELDMSQGLGRK